MGLQHNSPESVPDAHHHLQPRVPRSRLSCCRLLVRCRSLFIRTLPDNTARLPRRTASHRLQLRTPLRTTFHMPPTARPLLHLRFPSSRSAHATILEKTCFWSTALGPRQVPARLGARGSRASLTLAPIRPHARCIPRRGGPVLIPLIIDTIRLFIVIVIPDHTDLSTPTAPLGASNPAAHHSPPTRASVRSNLFPSLVQSPGSPAPQSAMPVAAELTEEDKSTSARCLVGEFGLF